MNLAHTGFFVLATNKTLHVTYWTRVRDFLKGFLLYGTVNWRRASDGLNPPRLSPWERKAAMPAANLEVIKPREKPHGALIKTQPKMAALPKGLDVTAGAIVSDPLLLPVEPGDWGETIRPAAYHHEEAAPVDARHQVDTSDGVIVRRRKRRNQRSVSGRLAPRLPARFPDAAKPGILARIFGTR